MLNFIELSEDLKVGNFQKILRDYKSNTDNLISDKENLREYLKELNLFFYMYFLIKFNNNLYNIYDYYKLSIVNSDEEFLIKLGREFLNKYRNEFAKEFQKSENKIINQAISFIETYYYEKIKLDDLSEKLHISKNYLCNLFRVQTGFTFCQYLNIVRLKEAKKLIDKGYNLQYISFECGFSSHAHFSTNFKKYFGITPGEYRKINKLY